MRSFSLVAIFVSTLTHSFLSNWESSSFLFYLGCSFQAMVSQPKQLDLLPIVCYHDSISCCQCVRPIDCGSYETPLFSSFIHWKWSISFDRSWSNATNWTNSFWWSWSNASTWTKVWMHLAVDCLSCFFLTSPYYRAFVNFYFDLTASCPIFWPVLLSFLFPYQASIHLQATVTTKSIMSNVYMFFNILTFTVIRCLVQTS